MEFNISAFSNIGTKREVNQDRILVFDKIADDGFINISQQSECFCFVADGIGGSVRGEIASQFVLEKIAAKRSDFINLSQEFIIQQTKNINIELIEFTKSNPEYYGSGTTLTGLIINENGARLTINAGDSAIRVYRNNMFFKITEDQVLDNTISGSPLISYFGGKQKSLSLDVAETLRDIKSQDIYVIASDGLFNALASKEIKAILKSNDSLENKSKLLLEKAIENKASDNVSCILIEVV